jgi:hypothetical protein
LANSHGLRHYFERVRPGARGVCAGPPLNSIRVKSWSNRASWETTIAKSSPAGHIGTSEKSLPRPSCEQMEGRMHRLGEFKYKLNP